MQRRPLPSAPDSKALDEEKAYARSEKELLLEGIRQDLAERKSYARYIFVLICVWLLGMFILLLIQGFLSPHQWFALSDAVILAAIGGTTINVLGIFIVVVNYLFPRKS